MSSEIKGGAIVNFPKLDYSRLRCFQKATAISICKLNCFLFILLITASYGCSDRFWVMIPKTVKWKEEVRLSDGSILIVTRSNKLVPPRSIEMGKKPQLRLGSTSLKFLIPGTLQLVEWISEWSTDRADKLFPLGIDVIDHQCYLVAIPSDCHGVIAWGWPVARYVLLKWNGEGWVQLDSSVFPKKLQSINLDPVGQGVIGDDRSTDKGYIDLQTQSKLIKNFTKNVMPGIESWSWQRIHAMDSVQSFGGEHKGIREICPEYIPIGDERWRPLNKFRLTGSRNGCLSVCKAEQVLSNEYCPCDTLFPKGK